MSESSQTNNRTSNKPNAMHLETSVGGILTSEQCDYKIPCRYTLYVEPRDLYDGCYIIGRSFDCGSDTEAQVTIEEKIAVLDLARVPIAINHMLSYPEVRYTEDVIYLPVAKISSAIPSDAELGIRTHEYQNFIRAARVIVNSIRLWIKDIGTEEEFIKAVPDGGLVYNAD